MDRYDPYTDKFINDVTDTISRQAAIDALNEYFVRIGKLKRRGLTNGEKAIRLDTVGAINSLPPAQPEKDVLAWLLAYHTKSFDLHGRYLAHEVIGWLIADFGKQYMQEGRTDG